jgi:hypothetical protein
MRNIFRQEATRISQRSFTALLSRQIFALGRRSINICCGAMANFSANEFARATFVGEIGGVGDFRSPFPEAAFYRKSLINIWTTAQGRRSRFGASKPASFFAVRHLGTHAVLLAGRAPGGDAPAIGKSLS